MGTRYTRFAQWRRRVLENTSPSTWIAIALTIVLIVSALVWINTRPLPDPLEDSDFNSIRERGALRVGVRSDIPGFGLRNAKSDGTVEWSGLEVDLAREFAKEIFGDASAVDFVPVDFTTRHIKLREDEVDFVIAVSPQGYSSSFVYSQPYYTDAVVAIVLKTGPQSLTGLQNSRIGAITRPSGVGGASLVNQGALTVLQQYNQNSQSQIELVSFSNIPDMFSSLLKGRILGLAIENALLSKHFDESTMKALPTAVGALKYSVVALPENDAYVSFVNQLIQQMREDGRMTSLYRKYNLTDYSNVN